MAGEPEFRVAAVDRAVLGLVNKGTPLAIDDRGRLDDPTRKHLAERVIERLDGPIHYGGKQTTLRSAIQSQARRLAVYLRAERGEYEPFVANW